MEPTENTKFLEARSSMESEELDFGDSNARFNYEMPKRDHTRRRQWVLLASNISLLLLNLGVFLMVTGYRIPRVLPDSHGGVRLPHQDWIAPALSEYETRTFDDQFSVHGKYRGLPRPELEEAWAYWVRNYTVRVPQPGWLDDAPPNRVLAEFQDEEGGIMGVFSFIHSIHCLKTIRQYMLPDFYPETIATFGRKPGEPLQRHMDHCIDMIRQSLLCHADMGLTVFEWSKDEKIPITINHKTQHMCVKESNVVKFLEENTVPPFGDILIHPWTGEQAFPRTEQKSSPEKKLGGQSQ
ncbi:hypothetical protein P154DRAFT_624775 [Amniculicola lignicola CBS 123094]|uniref:Tat pathway signal sequence n=1 Tax=Amniculicola lignicola CBS 123094 TaxID=1392246 RepID=A0A6A5W5D0_9PLEO|nr:hypothetical protein P154DRAFT_624775 [Amniculicola lignicola CBS 123094]